MQLHRPLATVAPTLDADVLQVLAPVDTAFTGRQVASLLPEHSQKGVYLALERLARQGVVTVEPAGAANLYRFNREHLASPYIRALTQLRQELLHRLEALVGEWELPAQFVAIFGSAARGEMRADSDIDVFVVSEHVGAATWDEQVRSLSLTVAGWTGNDCRVLEMSSDRVAADASSDPVLRDIAEEGLTVLGDPRYMRAAVVAGG